MPSHSSIILAVLAVSTLHVPTAAEGGVVAAPTSINFADTVVGTSRDEQLVLIEDNSDGVSEITDVKVVGDPAFTCPLKRGTILQSTKFLKTTVTFAPTVPGKSYKAELQITWKSGNNSETSSIKLSGQPLYTSPLGGHDYDPDCEACRIDTNQEKWVHIINEQLADSVEPAIQTHFREHFGTTTGKYSLPFSHIWKFSGLDVNLAQKLAELGVGPITIPEKCLDPKCLDSILQPISFTRVKGTLSVAEFTWDAPKKNDPFKFSVTLGKQTIETEIRFPRKVTGRSVISGSYEEFHFRKGQAPTLNYAVTGESGKRKVLFDGEISCINVSDSSCTIRSVSVTKPGDSAGIRIIPGPP